MMVRMPLVCAMGAGNPETSLGTVLSDSCDPKTAQTMSLLPLGGCRGGTPSPTPCNPPQIRAKQVAFVAASSPKMTSEEEELLNIGPNLKGWQ